MRPESCIRRSWNQKSPQAVARLAEFYDYYEIQPLGNNQFMIDSDQVLRDINSKEDLQDINRKIVKLGRTVQKAGRGDL